MRPTHSNRLNLFLLRLSNARFVCLTSRLKKWFFPLFTPFIQLAGVSVRHEKCRNRFKPKTKNNIFFAIFTYFTSSDINKSQSSTRNTQINSTNLKILFIIIAYQVFLFCIRRVAKNKTKIVMQTKYDSKLLFFWKTQLLVGWLVGWRFFFCFFPCFRLLLVHIHTTHTCIRYFVCRLLVGLTMVVVVLMLLLCCTGCLTVVGSFQ